MFSLCRANLDASLTLIGLLLKKTHFGTSRSLPDSDDENRGKGNRSSSHLSHHEQFSERSLRLLSVFDVCMLCLYI
jgi:hypothetical protein